MKNKIKKTSSTTSTASTVAAAFRTDWVTLTRTPPLLSTNSAYVYWIYKTRKHKKIKIKFF